MFRSEFHLKLHRVCNNSLNESNSFPVDFEMAILGCPFQSHGFNLCTKCQAFHFQMKSSTLDNTYFLWKCFHFLLIDNLFANVPLTKTKQAKANFQTRFANDKLQIWESPFTKIEMCMRWLEKWNNFDSFFIWFLLQQLKWPMDQREPDKPTQDTRLLNSKKNFIIIVTLPEDAASKLLTI